jgi:LuxR family transcriptional regulator, maltose regulon positive regulatory protein
MGEVGVDEESRFSGAGLLIPRPSMQVLQRHRVSDQIEHAAGHPVTVITGPAGAGKTVACSTWAGAAARQRRVEWLTLDVRDREPERFWLRLRSALFTTASRSNGGSVSAGSVSAGAASLPAQRLPVQPLPAQPVQPVPVQPLPVQPLPVQPLPVQRSRESADDLAAGLVEAARGLTGPVVLVLDDVHEVAGSAIVPGLDVLIHQAPRALHLILIGRRVPELALAKMRVAGDLAELGAADLACTADEADAYLAMLGLQAGPEERDALLRYTEGWMAGLRLSALSAEYAPSGGHAGPAGGEGRSLASVASLRNEPALAGFLRDEVLHRQPADVQLFLLRTSVAERLTGELADRVTARSGGARILDRLNDENIFVNRLPGGGGQFRYAPFFRDMLMAELRSQLPQEVPVLLRRVARWHFSRGEAVEAVRYAADAGDWEYASHALTEAGIGVLLRSPAAEAAVAGLEVVLCRFPAERRTDDPVVAAAFAAVRLCTGNQHGAAAHLARAQEALRNCLPAARPAVELWLAALRVMQAAGQPDAEAAALTAGWELAEQAQGATGTVAENHALGLLWQTLGTSMLRRWEICAARCALGHAEQVLAMADLAYPRERAHGWCALAEALYGDLDASGKIIAQLRAGDPADAVAAGFVPLASAQLALDRDDLNSALGLLDDADAVGAGLLPGEPDLVAIRDLIRACVMLAAGEPAGARALVAGIRARAGHAGVHSCVLGVLDADIALRAGDIVRAAAALSAAESACPRECANRALTRARLLLACNDPAGALELSSRYAEQKRYAGQGGYGDRSGVTLRDRTSALIIAALANRRLGAVATATGFLEQALAVAEPHGACRPFLDTGTAVQSAIVSLVPPTSRVSGFAARVIERFVCQSPGTECASDAGLDSPLSASELAVLRLLPTQLTNQEIAAGLFLSVNTIKTHLKSVYHKLGVRSRREAIARGRRLELL